MSTRWRAAIRGNAEMISPPARIVPDSGGSSPAAQFSSDDFPAPLGPTSPKTSPGMISSESSRTATAPLG